MLTEKTGYLAPEVAAGRFQGPEADLWAAGILFANLLEDHVPCLREYALTARDLAFAEHLCADLTAAVESERGCGFKRLSNSAHSFTIIAFSVLRSAAAVVCALLQTDPSLRPSARAALALLPTNASASLATPSAGINKKDRQVALAPLARRDSNSVRI